MSKSIHQTTSTLSKQDDKFLTATLPHVIHCHTVGPLSHALDVFQAVTYTTYKSRGW